MVTLASQTSLSTTSSMKLTELSADAVLYVAENMRQADKDEIYCGRWTDSPYDLTTDVMSAGGVSMVAWHLDEPVAVIGAVPVSPTLWSVIMFATDKLPEIGLPLTRFLSTTMVNTIFSPGVGGLRAECRSSVVHKEAHRWLELIGFKREALLKAVGKNGEDFYLYGFTNPCLQTD